MFDECDDFTLSGIIGEPFRSAKKNNDKKDDDENGGDKGDGKKGDSFVESRLNRAGMIFLSQPILDKTATMVMAKLLAFEQEDPKKLITLIVNSPGGSADSGFGIYDVMKFVKNPIRTICAGLCASAGVLVYLGGDKGKRYVLPHGRFMIHQPSTASQGQASDLEITAREIVKTREKVYELISDETGIDIKMLKKDSRRDLWLSAQEAVDYKLVDKIVTSSSEW